MTLNQFSKISPKVNRYGYLYNISNGQYTNTVSTTVKLKENEIGICEELNSLITMINDEPIILNGGSLSSDIYRTASLTLTRVNNNINILEDLHSLLTTDVGNAGTYIITKITIHTHGALTQNSNDTVKVTVSYYNETNATSTDIVSFITGSSFVDDLQTANPYSVESKYVNCKLEVNNGSVSIANISSAWSCDVFIEYIYNANTNPHYIDSSLIIGDNGGLVFLDTTNKRLVGHKPANSGTNAVDLSRLKDSSQNCLNHPNGNYSVTEGYYNTASGNYSHAEGSRTIASSVSAHSEGYGAKARGPASHSEGYYTDAEMSQCHSEGYETYSKYYRSHAEGKCTAAIGEGAHSEGVGMDNTEVSGTYLISRLDSYYATEISAENESRTQSNLATFTSFGQVINNTNNHDFYDWCRDVCKRKWESSVLDNTINIASMAIGYASHAEGRETTAYGSGSHAEGYRTFANDNAAHAEGSYTFATGNYSHAEGSNNRVSGNCSHVEGYNNIVYSSEAHAEGKNNTLNATAIGGHVEGSDNTVIGECGHAQGISTRVSHRAGSASGIGTKTGREAQFSVGKYNVAHGNTLFEVGNGTDNSSRSNVFEVYINGTATLGGDSVLKASAGETGQVLTKTAAGCEWQAINTADDDNILNFSMDRSLVNSGYLSFTNGTPVTSANYNYSDFMRVKDGDSFTYSLNPSSTAVAVIAFYNIEQTYVAANSIGGQSRLLTGTWTAPSDGYIRICIHKNTASTAVFTGVEIYSDSVKEKFSDVNTLISSKDVNIHHNIGRLFNTSRDLRYTGYRIDITTGAEAVSSNHYITDYLFIRKGETFHYRMRTEVTTTPGVAFYHSPSSDTYYDNIPANSEASGDYTATVDTYIRLCSNKNQLSIFEFYVIDSVPNNTLAYIAENTIVKRNKDIEDVVHASCDSIRTSGNKNDLCLLIGGDFHQDSKRLDNMVEYLNNVSCIDAGIVLGDIVGNNYSNDATFYTTAVSKTTKSFLTVIGNHDVATGSMADSVETTDDVYTKYISPNISYANLTASEYTTGKTYYYKDFTSYNIRLICLNQYDYPSDMNGDSYLYERGLQLFSQEQVTWLCNTLLSVPSGYGVIIAMHHQPYNMIVDTSDSFTSLSASSTISNAGYTGSIIPDIVNAFINGTSINETYTLSAGSTWSSLTANVDFSSRGDGNFLCYIGGHWHMTMLQHPVNYPDQLMITCNSGSFAWTNIRNSDTPRKEGTKSEDSLLVLSANAANRTINIVMVGARYNYKLSERLIKHIDLTSN